MPNGWTDPDPGDPKTPDQGDWPPEPVDPKEPPSDQPTIDPRPGR